MDYDHLARAVQVEAAPKPKAPVSYENTILTRTEEGEVPFVATNYDPSWQAEKTATAHATPWHLPPLTDPRDAYAPIQPRVRRDRLYTTNGE